MRQRSHPILRKLIIAVAVLLANPTAQAAADPCGGISLDNGIVRLGRTLEVATPLKPQDQRCLLAVAEQLHELPGLRNVTIAARSRIDSRSDNSALQAAQAAAALFAQRGIPPFRLSTLAPAIRRGEQPHIGIVYAAQIVDKPVAWLRSVGGLLEGGRSRQRLSRIKVGETIYEGHFVRTGNGSRALMQLRDGSVVRVEPLSLLRLVEVVRSPTDPTVELELLEGYAEATVARKTDGADFRIRSANAVAGVRGTVFRYAADGEVTRLETTHGSVRFTAAGSTVDATAAKGTRAIGAAAPEPLRDLLAAPSRLLPHRGPLPSDGKLSWQPIDSAATYIVQLSGDPDFIDGVELFAVDEAQLILPQRPAVGQWYWRVVAQDADGFVGLVSKIYGFEIPAQ